MIYKPFHDLNISQLGMGNMHLPTVGDRGPINEEKARKIIEYAYSPLVTVDLPPSLRPKTSGKYIS